MLPSRARIELGETQRFRGIGDRVSKDQHPPADIVPGPGLETDAMVNAYRLKAGRFQQADTGRIRQRHSAVGSEKSLEPKKRAKSGEEPFANPPTPPVGSNVNADVDRPAIGRAFPTLTGVGIAQDLIPALTHQPWVSLRYGSDPTCHLGHARRPSLE